MPADQVDPTPPTFDGSGVPNASASPDAPLRFSTVHAAIAISAAVASVIIGALVIHQSSQSLQHQTELHAEQKAKREAQSQLFDHLHQQKMKELEAQVAAAKLEGVKALKKAELGNAQFMVKKLAHGAAMGQVENIVKDRASHEDGVFFQLASIAAHAATLARTDPKLTVAERAVQSQRNADRAVELLGKAVDEGFQNTKLLSEDVYLSKLQSRDDFQNLLHRLGVQQLLPAVPAAAGQQKGPP